jgi:hypothetical protein
VWERRSVWLRGRPRGWDDAWRRSLHVISAQGRGVEERPDTYLVLDRADAGLKLRGSDENDFDLKVRHQRTGDWELWEKSIFTTWNALEAARLAAMLRLNVPTFERVEETTPERGVEDLLDQLGVPHTRVVVSKKRIQAAGRDLMSVWPSLVVDSTSIIELVEITLPGRTEPVFSFCFESGAPLPEHNDPFDTSDALYCGYPELLLRLSKDSGSNSR